MTDMASQFAGYAVRFHIKYDHAAIELLDAVSEGGMVESDEGPHTLPEAKKSPRWLKRILVACPLPGWIVSTWEAHNWCADLRIVLVSASGQS